MLTVASGRIESMHELSLEPLHASQQVLAESEGKTILQIEVVSNFELEWEILGFGSGLKVLGPRLLAKRVAAALRAAAAR